MWWQWHEADDSDETIEQQGQSEVKSFMCWVQTWGVNPKSMCKVQDEHE